ncbi:T6SS effector amidase Tae4 family protein [Acinetobacter sp. AS167]|uniref:T6SS effector amidase Tae4 family protein n=1 Tax=Acinetobacter sp. AS167 TaxID=3127884 RepID=UPI003019466E
MTCTITAIAQDKTVHCIANRPSWAAVSSFYQDLANTMSTDELFIELFGPDYNRGVFNNSCATRVSVALLHAGVKDVGREYNVQYGEFKSKGITVSAVNMRKLLQKKWNSPEVPSFKTEATTTLADLQREIGGRKGVFSFVSSDQRSFGASGHITIWDGTDVIHGTSKYPNQAYADGNLGTVCLWELK